MWIFIIFVKRCLILGIVREMYIKIVIKYRFYKRSEKCDGVMCWLESMGNGFFCFFEGVLVS